MAEAIIARRGGAGEAIVEFESFTPTNTVAIFHPDGELGSRVDGWLVIA